MANDRAVLEKIKTGEINSEEGLTLLDKTNKGKGVGSFFRLLFSPYDSFSTGKIFFAGIFTVTVLTLLSPLLRVKYDGVVQLHIISSLADLSKTSRVLYYMTQSVMVWLWVSFFYFIVSRKFISSKTRFIDFLGIFGLARLPYVFAAIVVSRFWIGSYEMNSLNMDKLQGYVADPFFQLGTLLLVIFAVWFMVMNFFAVKVSLSLSTGRTWLYFVFGMIACEIMCQYQISLLFRGFYKFW